jgi:uncharacterized membrane protein
MFIRVSDSHTRSIGKAISWRIVGTVDTFVITLVITGNLVVAGSIASVESISKIILYYLHERAWSKVTLGRKEPVSAARAGVAGADSQFETCPAAVLTAAPLICNLSTVHRSIGAST